MREEYTTLYKYNRLTECGVERCGIMTLKFARDYSVSTFQLIVVHSPYVDSLIVPPIHKKNGLLPG
jgi:hypothetical protein